MVMQRFNDFWAAEKSITDDVFFAASASHTDIYVFDRIRFVGENCEGFAINGNYNCRDGSMTFNFYIEGIGAVRRFDLGGSEHGSIGRYHEHILYREQDASPLYNLPHAVRREDLKGMEPLHAWLKICLEAHVTHTGLFKDPTEWCK